MKTNDNDIKKLLKAMCFKPENGTNDIYSKIYNKNYTIRINFNSKKIEYRPAELDEKQGICWGDETTANFSKSENFVVLECVDRLIEKGYSPQNIHLEYKFPLGRELKGKLDILVFDDSKKAYLMIECKTWGIEFDKEHKKMIKDGGQLFSYFVQDKSTQYLCLYTSQVTNEIITYKNEIIAVDEYWSKLNNQKEIHEHWNKNVKDNGIFDNWVTAYNVEIKALIRERLQPLTKGDSGRIYNQFAEILRHNVVSDKPNAFNKILNLFICKIIDEDRKNDDELFFQWRENDSDEKLQLRLNDLYKKGMHQFLDINVTDYTEADITNKLINITDENIQKEIKNMFVKLRLQKNPEFSFIEVYDEMSFKRNARVIREVVELLQPYQFRYGHKHQFLGDFFELLLNTSIKQESGQFFTPVLITKYIISSIPIKEFIENKISKEEPNVLPTVIDFACGTGHFLTEYMDRVQNIIENQIDKNTAIPTIRKDLNLWTGDDGKFDWAREYVYGIDADYRLVKSAKVSSFLNGDGEANIIRANGLDNFEYSKEYKGKLKNFSDDDHRNNEQFDILIANPPYSVNSFKSTLKWGNISFELFDRLTDNSSEIECLFIERMKQLLKTGGYAGIILPSSILSNTGIYTNAREIILKYFKIIAITKFGTNTFMATGTKTVTLFLEKRPTCDYQHITNAINTFFDNFKDITVLGIENAFSNYVLNVYDTISFEDYVTFVNRKPNKNIQHLQNYKDYRKWFENLSEIQYLKTKKAFTDLSELEQTKKLDELFYQKVFSIEKDKLLYFLLTYNQKTVITKVGDKQTEKDFIGYEFSTHRGHEGIKMLASGTKLYDDTGTLNSQKANSYIYNAFIGKYDTIDNSLVDNVKFCNTFNLINFSTVQFDKIISINSKKKIDYSKFGKHNKFISLGLISSIEKGKIITKKSAITGNIPVVAGGKKIPYYHNVSNRPADIITVSASGSAGYVSYWNIPIYASDCYTIISNTSDFLTKYIYYCLLQIQQEIYSLQKGQAQPHVYGVDLQQLQIPCIDILEQQKIVDEITIVENQEKEDNDKIQINKNKIDEIVNKCFMSNYALEKIGNISEIYNGGTPSTSKLEYWNGNINWVTLVDTKTKYVSSTKRKITDKGLSSCNTTLLPINTVLFSSRATIGEVSIAKTELCTNQGYKNFVCDSSKLYYEYLYYILIHESKNLENLASGMTYPEISKSMIKEYKIPLPPLAKQQEIVNEIELLETEITVLNDEIKKVEEKKKVILDNYLL